MLFVFFSSKCSLFHNANLFGSCIIHISYTGVLKLKKKNNSGAKGLIRNSYGKGYYSFRILTHNERGLKTTERSNARTVTGLDYGV